MNGTQGLPHRTLRTAIFFLYIAMAYCCFMVLALMNLNLVLISVFGVLLFGMSVPLWLAMRRLVRKGVATDAISTDGSEDPLAALDEEAGRGEASGSGSSTPAAPARGIQETPMPAAPHPEPLPNPAKYVKVTWQRTQKLEGYLPVENVKVISQEDTDVEVVKED